MAGHGFRLMEEEEMGEWVYGILCIGLWWTGRSGMGSSEGSDLASESGAQT